MRKITENNAPIIEEAVEFYLKHLSKKPFSNINANKIRLLIHSLRQLKKKDMKKSA